MSRRKYNVIGAPLPRVDVTEKILGTARYADDYQVPGMLHCALVLSPHAHAEVLSIDADPAREVDGVVAVFTAGDVPVNQIGAVFQDQPLLATDKVRFVGDRVAIVVGETRDAARAGAAAVQVQYKPLPGLFDAREAHDSQDVSIHLSGNLVAHQKVRHGLGLEAVDQCEVVLEKEFTVNYQEHAYLEPQGALAIPEADGSITIMGSMQAPFYVQAGVARALRLDQNRVRVLQTVTGGAFGGKEDYPTEVAAVPALVTLLLNRPAKLIYTRQEDMQVSTKRHRMRMRYRIGANQDGRLQALHVTQWVDAGGYAGLSTVVAERANTTAAGPYYFPHAHVDTYIVYTNNLFGGAFRGFGNPQVTFAIENMLELLADKLGKDPVEVRRQNLLHVGQPVITGAPLPPSGPSEAILDSVLAQAEWASRQAELDTFNQANRWRKRGLGLALSMYGCCLHAGGQRFEGSGALVQVRADGSVEINIGGTELGQGAFTVVAQIAAETLGADYARVRVLPTDTRLVPDSGPTVASRTTVMSGNATRGAALQLRARLVEVAAQLLDCPSREVEVGKGVYRGNGKEVGFTELCREAFVRKVNLFSSGWYAPPPKEWDNDTGQGLAYVVYCFTGHVAEVEVDLVGGLVQVRKVWAAHDVGQVVNRQMIEGQVHGGIVQGMGWGLTENLILDHGKCLNPGFTDYLIPSALDMPEMHMEFIEDPYPDGPFGAKGIGEPSLISVPTAVALAAANAVGARPDHLPVTPETILRWTADNQSD